VVTCRKGRGEYTLGIGNNTWKEARFRITSLAGAIRSIHECVIDTAERSAVGCLPEGLENADEGKNTAETIAGGDIRIFTVKVAETKVAETPHRRPPSRPAGRWLTLRETRSIKESILSRPTFFEHFDGVVVDWRYLHDREIKPLAYEARWIGRQKLRVAVDLSSGMNSYPTMRLVDNQLEDYAIGMEMIDDVLAKLGTLGAKDLIFSLHRAPENNFTAEQASAAFEQGMKNLAIKAAAFGVTVHVRVTLEKATQRIADLVGMIERAAQPNLKLAPATSALMAGNSKRAEITRLTKGKVGLWLHAAVRSDLGGHPWDFHAPLHSASDSVKRQAGKRLKPAAGVPVVLDGIYADQSAEYLETQTLKAQGR